MNNNRTSGIPHAMQLYVSLIRTQMSRGEIPIYSVMWQWFLTEDFRTLWVIVSIRWMEFDSAYYCANYFGVGHTLWNFVDCWFYGAFTFMLEILTIFQDKAKQSFIKIYGRYFRIKPSRVLSSLCRDFNSRRNFTFVVVSSLIIYGELYDLEIGLDLVTTVT